jgi:hypothetical protein
MVVEMGLDLAQFLVLLVVQMIARHPAQLPVKLAALSRSVHGMWVVGPCVRTVVDTGIPPELWFVQVECRKIAQPKGTSQPTPAHAVVYMVASGKWARGLHARQSAELVCNDVMCLVKLVEILIAVVTNQLPTRHVAGLRTALGKLVTGVHAATCVGLEFLCVASLAAVVRLEIVRTWTDHWTSKAVEA